MKTFQLFLLTLTVLFAAAVFAQETESCTPLIVDNYAKLEFDAGHLKAGIANPTKAERMLKGVSDKLADGDFLDKVSAMSPNSMNKNKGEDFLSHFASALHPLKLVLS